ncbi:hypothetical protein [Pseudactinotalea sp. HY158]|uniref:YobI family P-loop NTPase n=1 Tax=Pseudactinotalea sp. HY158 TaxID=2654547 RepID=UPI00129C28FD|nr:hypothetical protein [Pseudactinotalea sp. HY158]QGH69303.1 hypothetical protein GCE65_07075 [Pseudactinotalea sp. HY158]
MYVQHLEDAVKDPKNRNIALTGRYGSGKSSVLDEFQKKHESTTIRISINTLGPDKDDKDLTNRIQKELVKQLIYRAKPGKLRRSRFARSRPLTPWRALVQAGIATTVGLTLLWLVGLRHAEPWFGPTTDRALESWLTALFIMLTWMVVWGVRWVIGDRIVSEVATAGTTITLGERATTYFDGFLDEIVTFFDAVKPEYVIVEDLDRFDDPKIFDSLRELNTLINESSRWKSRDHPLRFIYAIKDSLFEQLGAESDREDPKRPARGAPDSTTSEAATDVPAVRVGAEETEKRAHTLDLAEAAVERANRTKFFELVIPMVPFITHRNARDHLSAALRHLRLPDDMVSRALLDLVARHATDMRLLINICNEFVVFAEKLLWVETSAPGMEADDLFALVSYKNFHLADFEAIPQRSSTLDILEQHRRDLVRTTIEDLQMTRRERVHTEEQRRRRDELAKTLGARLRSITDALPPRFGWSVGPFEVGDEQYSVGAIDGEAFWGRVATSGSLAVVGNHNYQIEFSGERLALVFPEAADPKWWAPPSAADLERQVKQIDDDIAHLRGADFDGLAQYERFPSGSATFSARITNTLKSDLARDLVRRGFITRNYAEYSAVFYGSFIGVDVAFFYNHSVQPNEMYLDHEFTTKNAVSNLLEQVPADFTSTVSAFNIQVATYLVTERPDDAKSLVAFVIADRSKDSQTFLDAFLNAADAPRERLIELLAAHPWSGLFNYLTNHPGLPDETTRIRLVDAAMLSAHSVDLYEVDESTRAWFTAHYRELSAFNMSQSSERTDRIFTFAKEARITVVELDDLASPLRDRIVDAQMYEITTANLRRALSTTAEPTLDEVRKRDIVWDYVRSSMNVYLTAVRGEDAIEYVVLSEPVLVDVLNEQCEFWTGDQLEQVLEASSPVAAVDDLTDVPSEVWPALAGSSLVRPTVANIWRYAQHHGIDEHMARFLTLSGSDPIELRDVDETDAEDRRALAAQILNTSGLIPSRSRVRLAERLDLAGHIDVVDLVAAADDLLARAIEADLVADSFETFSHFARAGWAAVSEAFGVSGKVSEFFGPTLVDGLVADLVRSPQVPDALRRVVVENLRDYVHDGDSDGLAAAGQYARANRIRLPLDEVRRIAQATQNPDLVVGQLVHLRDTAPDDVIDVLAVLGAPYSQLLDGAGSEFDLPSGSSNNTLFQRLESKGKVEIVSRGRRGGRKVRVLA